MYDSEHCFRAACAWAAVMSANSVPKQLFRLTIDRYNESCKGWWVHQAALCDAELSRQ